MQKFKQSWIFFIHECLYQLTLEVNLAELVWRRSLFQLSLFVNLLLPPFVKWCGLSLPKTIFFHLIFSFVYLDIFLKVIQYEKRSALSYLCALKRTCDSDNQVPLPIAPFKKYHLYSIQKSSWLNYSSLEYDDEAVFSASI